MHQFSQSSNQSVGNSLDHSRALSLSLTHLRFFTDIKWLNSTHSSIYHSRPCSFFFFIIIFWYHLLFINIIIPFLVIGITIYLNITCFTCWICFFFCSWIHMRNIDICKLLIKNNTSRYYLSKNSGFLTKSLKEGY